MDLTEAAIQEVKRAESAKSRGFRATGEVPEFIDGRLVVVEFKDEDGDLVESFVYFKDDKPHVFKEAIDLANFVGKAPELSGVSRALLSFVRSVGVPGVVALATTAVALFLFVQGKVIPELLGNGWTVILGFYFGTKAR